MLSCSFATLLSLPPGARRVPDRAELQSYNPDRAVPRQTPDFWSLAVFFIATLSLYPGGGASLA